MVVWLVTPSNKGGEGGLYEKKMIFQDDGKGISTASSAVIVAINPEGNGGRKQVCVASPSSSSLLFGAFKDVFTMDAGG